MKIYENLTELIGKTPLVKLPNFSEEKNISATLLAKVEFFNPAGSVKDRVALNMIEDAEKKGLLKKGSVIIEPTSGNTGIGLAMVSAIKGYKTILTMPDTMSIERIKLLKAYGAEIVLTEGSKGMQGAIDKANELHRETEGSIIAGQFENIANPEAHIRTTAKEIFEDTDGKIDIFVAGIGTGGTLSGVGKYLKDKNPEIKIIGVEPLKSPLLTEGYASPHGIQGIGANFIPENLDREIYDEIIAVSDEDAMNTGKELAKKEGMLVGISSGAAVFAATQIALRKENERKIIVVLLPDTGTRYLSTSMFDE